MTGRKWVPALVVATVVGGASCQGTAPPGPPAEARPSTPAPAVAGSGRPFEPPSDGRLKPAQVEMYIAVRRQALALSKASPTGAATAAEQLVDVAASERRAVNELARDVDEYRWVSARVAEASPPVTGALGGLASAIEAAGRKGRQQMLEKAGEHVPVTPGEPSPDDSTRAYNRDLLDRYRSELDALRPPAAPSPSPAGRPRS